MLCIVISSATMTLENPLSILLRFVKEHLFSKISFDNQIDNMPASPERRLEFFYNLLYL